MNDKPCSVDTKYPLDTLQVYQEDTLGHNLLQMQNLLRDHEC